MKIDSTVFLFLAVAVLTLPINWLLAAITAAAVHELCHVLALLMLKESILSFQIGAGGAVIETAALDRKTEFICALAGPAGSLMLALCYRWMPHIALCAVVQAVYNLLPIYPLDGGRMLRCILNRFFEQTLAERICKWTECFVLAGIMGLALLAVFCLHMGIFPMIPLMLLMIKKNSLQCDAIRGTMDITFVKR